MVNDTEDRRNNSRPVKTNEDRSSMADPPANGDDRSASSAKRSSRTTRRTDHGPTKSQSGSDRSKSESSCTSVSGRSVNEEDQMEMSKKVLQLVTDSRFTMTQINGQRKLGGPPPGWKGPAPGPGCEVFVGKIPRTLYEHEIYPVFRAMGEVYEIRLMMDFSGTNRGYCFVMFSRPEYAQRAIQELDNYEIRPGRRIGVVASVNNCRLCVGQLPPDVASETVIKKICTITDDVGKVAVYRNTNDQARYALISYKTHRGAAMARRRLVPDRSSLFEGAEVNVDWAHPNMIPSNVVEDSGICDENGNVQMTTTMVGNENKRSTSRRRVRDEFLDRSIRTYLQEERDSIRSGDPCGRNSNGDENNRPLKNPGGGSRFLFNVNGRSLEHLGEGQGGTARRVLVKDEEDRFEVGDPWNEVEGSSSDGDVRSSLENFNQLECSTMHVSKCFPNGRHEEAIGWSCMGMDGCSGGKDRQDNGMLRSQEPDNFEIADLDRQSVTGQSMNLFDKYTFAHFSTVEAVRSDGFGSVEGPVPEFSKDLESRSDGDIRKPNGIEAEEEKKRANFVEFGKWNTTETGAANQENELCRRCNDTSERIDGICRDHRRTERNGNCQQSLLQVLLKDARDHSECCPNSSGSSERNRSDRHYGHPSAFADPWMINNANDLSKNPICPSNKPDFPREHTPVNYPQDPAVYSSLRVIGSKSQLNGNHEVYYQNNPCSAGSHVNPNACDLENCNFLRSSNFPHGTNPVMWNNRNVLNYLQLANCSYRYRNCEQSAEGLRRSNLFYLPKNFNAYQGAWSPVNVLPRMVSRQISNLPGDVRCARRQVHSGYDCGQNISGCITNGSDCSRTINCRQNDHPRTVSNDRIHARLSSEQNPPKGARPILNRSHVSICNKN